MVKQDLIMYSAEELMQLRTAVMSQKWPSYLDEAFKNNRGTWDPDRWHQNKKRGSTPPPSDDRTSDKGTKKDEANEAGVNKVGMIFYQDKNILYFFFVSSASSPRRIKR